MNAMHDPLSVLQGQPHLIIERDGVRYTLLGTAHVSRASVDAVEAAIGTGQFDTIAVELDAPARALGHGHQQAARLDRAR